MQSWVKWRFLVIAPTRTLPGPILVALIPPIWLEGRSAAPYTTSNVALTAQVILLMWLGGTLNSLRFSNRWWSHGELSSSTKP